MSKSKTKPNDPGRLERGVDGRDITVMHNGAQSRITNDGILLDSIAEKSPAANGRLNGAPKQYPRDEDVEPRTIPVERHDSRRPMEIKFADTVKRSDGVRDGSTKLPPLRSDEEHIAILQRQRNPNADEVLRIPGPRDAERGMGPEIVVGDEDEDVDPYASRRGRLDSNDSARSTPGRPMPERAITIEEPEKPTRQDEIVDDARAIGHAFSVFKLRKPRILSKHDQRLHHDENNLHPVNTLHTVPTTQSRRRQTFGTIREALTFTRNRDEMTPYLSWEPTLGRNSAFPNLSDEQREELGGIEYRSLKTLALVLAFYFWGFWILGLICLVPWILNTSYGSVVDAAGQNRPWWGIWTASSAFMDLGFTLTPDSMNSFNTAVFPLLLMSFLIVIGNTGFPVMLRFVIWFTSLFVPRNTGLYEEFRFLLDHPRRCFTLLFPSGATWWLFWLLVILNGLDLIFFIVLDVSSL